MLATRIEAIKRDVEEFLSLALHQLAHHLLLLSDKQSQMITQEHQPSIHLLQKVGPSHGVQAHHEQVHAHQAQSGRTVEKGQKHKGVLGK